MPLAAQTVRFDTNVGTFDVVLNPTENDGLQSYVDNFLSYVNAGRYNMAVINRADDGTSSTDPADDFVLQMGGFQATTTTLPEDFNVLTAVESFATLTQDTSGDNIVDLVSTSDGLTNSRGTISLALSGSPSNVNSGTREFFVNVGRNNDFLDIDGGEGGFVPFADVTSMATIDLIMSLQKVSIANSPSPEIPVIGEQGLVYIQKATVMTINEPEIVAAAAASILSEPVVSSSEDLLDGEESELAEVSASSELLATSSLASLSNQGATLQSLSIPEPPALVLAIGALMAIAILKRK